MNILYCGDSNIKKGIELSVKSVIKYNKNPVNIFIVTANINFDGKSYKSIDERFAEKLRKTAKSTNEDSDVCLIDISEKFSSALPVANMDTRFTPLCMLRLFADEIEIIPDKILYLDADVLCLKTIDELYNQPIADFDLAGVLDRYGSWLFRKHIFHRDYLNSGVLLLNMEKIRSDGLFKRCREVCISKKMFMPDQSAINKLAVKKILPRKFNEQGKIKSETVFKHFATFFRFFPYFKAITVKPWEVEKVHKVLKLYCFDDIILEGDNNE